MSFRNELLARIRAWREENGTAICPREEREKIEADLRASRPPQRATGLASLSPERRAEISAAGGRAAHAGGRAYKFDPTTAKAMGERGGARAWELGKAHRFTSAEAKAAGAKGVESRGAAKEAAVVE